MATPMLPGLGGGTGGVQLSGTAPLPSPTVNNNLAPSPAITGFPAPTNTTNAPALSAPGAAPVPSGTLPTPQPSGVSPTGHTTALPGQNAPAGTPVVPGTNMPQAPAPNITQLLNDPSLTSPNGPVDLSKYGTMGTAAQPTSADIGAKYQAAYDAVKSKAAPATGGDARSAVTSALNETKPEPKPDPQADFMDKYSNMNPVVKRMFDNVQTLLSAQNTKQTLVDEFTKLQGDTQLQGLKTDLLNVQNVMKGTEDDIRNEITKTGGFATNSQVMALTAARNKTLLTQASFLQDQITQKEDYIKQIMDLTKADYADAAKQVDEKINLDEKVAEMQVTMDNAAIQNYQKIVENIGYDGLASSFNGNTQAMNTAERLLGLAPGALSNPDFLAEAKTLKQQQLDATNAQRDITNQLAMARLEQGNQRINISLGNANSLNNYRSALTELADARSKSAYATAVNSTIRALYPSAAANPINLYQSSSQWINKVNTSYAASTDPNNTAKNVSDLELLDAAVKINNGGQQITEAQVNTLLKGAGIPQKVTVAGGKLAGISAILSDDQRLAIKNLAQSTFAGQEQLANTAVGRINDRLATTNMPADLNLDTVKMAMSTPQSKGTMSNSAFVDSAVTANGIDYNSFVNNVPDGKIPVVENDSGQTGYLDAGEFDPSLYTKM